MVIGIFGESCTGKSTIAKQLEDQMNAIVYSGKDYLRLAKNPQEAAARFAALLADPANDSIFVISEPDQLQLLPNGALRVRVSAALPVISARFAERMGGKLPPPVAAMLEKKHGMFDDARCDLHVDSDVLRPQEAAEMILYMVRERTETPV